MLQYQYSKIYQKQQGLKQQVFAQSPTLTSLPLFSSRVPLFTWVSQNPFKQNPLPEVWREKEWARQIGREEEWEREFSA